MFLPFVCKDRYLEYLEDILPFLWKDRYSKTEDENLETD